MDNVTHALAGLLLGEATVASVEARTGTPAARGFRGAALAVGVAAAEFPDADLLYSGWAGGGGKLGYLLHHRGHTHTVVMAVLGALLVWGVALLVRRAARHGMERGALLALALVGTLGAHLLLDFTNSYGVHPWWPLSGAWEYGDAIFIVEPWLWVASVPPLLGLARTGAGRAGYVLLLLAIVAASWRVSMVGAGVALAITLGAAGMLALAWLVRQRRGQLVRLGLGAWLVIEAIFARSSARAAQQVAKAIAPDGAVTLADVVLTPAVGDPLCFHAITVELDGATYRASEATVAPWPRLRAATACPARASLADSLPLAPHPGTRAVRWGRAWSAPRAELAPIARENCVVAAALRFMRVPVWSRAGDSTVTISDLRFSSGGGGFADFAAPRVPTACPTWVPPWDPPRGELLRP